MDLSNLKFNFKTFVLIQLLLSVVGYAVTLLFFNYIYANSFFIGAITMFIANFVFFSRLFIKKQLYPILDITVFYLSAILKLSIISIITIILAVYFKPKLFSYISGLCLLQLLACFMTIFFKKP